jgi:hypothetical protein
MKSNSQLNTILIDEVGKKKSIIKREKKWVNLFKNKLWDSIHNWPNVKNNENNIIS